MPSRGCNQYGESLKPPRISNWTEGCYVARSCQPLPVFSAKHHPCVDAYSTRSGHFVRRQRYAVSFRTCAYAVLFESRVARSPGLCNSIRPVIAKWVSYLAAGAVLAGCALHRDEHGKKCRLPISVTWMLFRAALSRAHLPTSAADLLLVINDLVNRSLFAALACLLLIVASSVVQDRNA